MYIFVLAPAFVTPVCFGALCSVQVMATAFSNVAADNLLEGALELGMHAVRIGRPATVRPTLWHATLDALVENHPEVVGEKDGRERVRGGEGRRRGYEGVFSPERTKRHLASLPA